MKYFDNCKTKEAAKKKFRKLAKELHPDTGGNEKDMVELKRQFEIHEKSFIGSENAFREGINDKYREQQKDSSYFRSQDELQQLRDENTRLRGQLYEYEFKIKRLSEMVDADVIFIKKDNERIRELEGLKNDQENIILDLEKKIEEMKNVKKDFWTYISEALLGTKNEE